MYKLLWILGGVLAFIACNQKASGLKTSPVSGYQYNQFTSNDGPKPKVGEFAYFNMDIYDDKDSLLQTYRNQKIRPSIRILDPTDNMRKRNPVVDILSALAIGDSAAILVPTDSVPNMPPGYEDITHIEYHVTLEEILTETEHQERITEQRQQDEAEMTRLRNILPEVEELTSSTLAAYNAGDLKLEETPGGVKYHIHERGTGDIPTNDLMVTWQYYGRTVTDGNMFDNSFARGKGYSFRVGRDAVIQGWHDAAPFLPVGTRASLFLPPDMGYGAIGSPPDIPANAELYFYVTVEELLY